MFEIFNHDSKIPFVRWGRITVTIAFALMLASIVLMFKPGFNLALDFTGGTLIELEFEQDADLPKVREALAQNGYGHALVQSFGNARGVMVRLSPRDEVAGEATPAADAKAGDATSPAGAKPGDAKAPATDASTKASEQGAAVHDLLAKAGLKSTLKRNEFVGPQVGKELSENGFVAIIVVLAGILIYIAMRFQFKFGIAAIVGEVHDVLVTAAIFILLGKELDVTVLAGFLSVAGYSINDKVVVFDRIREMFRSTTRAEPAEIVNRSINTTLSRTIMTSLTTALAMVGLYVFGGPSVENFGLVMLIGIVVGTLSSIMFSAQLLLMMGVSKRDLMPRAKDVAELERRP
jgi:preprotein translocase subunit SecF